MNDPETKEDIVATVKIKDKAGQGVLTEIPLKVDWTFSDPGTANTSEANSYEYAGGKFLGKAQSATARFWEAHPDSAAESDDGFKLTARSTVSIAGAKKGMASIKFLPSGVGGDDFKLKAAVKKADGTELKSVESGVLTVWRKAELKNVYEMDGVTHISSNSTKAIIQPYFTPAFVEYDVAAGVTKVTNVLFVGLWKNDGTHQKDWTVIRTKTAAETPTAGEIADYNGADPAKKAAATTSITTKAQNWVTRIDNDYFASQSAWLEQGNNSAAFPANSIIGVNHYHPKYSNFAGQATTTEWTNVPGIVVTTYGGNYPNIAPDGLWTDFNGFGGLTHSNGRVSIPTGFPVATIQRAIAHEVGHATSTFFKRDQFGPNLDHSTAAGLMDPNQTQAAFTDRELKILRGIKP